MVLKNKQAWKQNDIVWTHIDVCVVREEVRKDSKVEAARLDQSVRRGAPTRDEVATYTFKFVYRELSCIYTRTHFPDRFEFYEMVAYLLPN